MGRQYHSLYDMGIKLMSKTYRRHAEEFDEEVLFMLAPDGVSYLPCSWPSSALGEYPLPQPPRSANEVEADKRRRSIGDYTDGGLR